MDISVSVCTYPKGDAIGMEVTRRTFLATAGAGLTSNVLAARPQDSVSSNHPQLTKAPEHPNVLFILVDDLGNRIRELGDPYAVTPNIDALIRGGIGFTNQFVQIASCAPARTALLTGMYPDTTRGYNNRKNFRVAVPDAVMLPEQFRRHGYHTVPIGKVGPLNVHEREPAWTHKVWKPKGDFPTYYNPDTIGRPPAEVGTVSAENYFDWQVTERAMRQISDFEEGEPWFVVAGLNKPHMPFTAPGHCWNLYDPDEFQIDPLSKRPLNAPEFNGRAREIALFDGVPKSGPLSEEMARHLVHAHYAC